MRHIDPLKASFRWRRALVLAIGLGVMATATIGAPIASAVGPFADLSVTMSHEPSTARTGEGINFTLTVSNGGPDVATDVATGLRLEYPFQVLDIPDECSTSSSEYRSVVCELGDLASGASTSVVISVMSTSSGVFVVPAVATSSTPDLDTTDLDATQTIIVLPGPSVGERYVSGTFPIVLDRPANDPALAYWAPRAQEAFFAGPDEIQAIPLGLLGSNEYRRLRVREAYTRILGRPASAGDVAYWSDRVRTGTSYNRVEQLLIGSTEFAAKHPTDAIDAVYLAVLRREPGDAEPVGVVTSLSSLAANLQRTTEGRDVIINDRYQKTLGHGPEPLGRYVWQVELGKGTSA